MQLVRLLLANTRSCPDSLRPEMVSSSIPLQQRPVIGPILVLCYTNHALDAFLMDLVNCGITEGIIRVGRRCDTQPCHCSHSVLSKGHARQQSVVYASRTPGVGFSNRWPASTKIKTSEPCAIRPKSTQGRYAARSCFFSRCDQPTNKAPCSVRACTANKLCARVMSLLCAGQTAQGFRSCLCSHRI